MWEHAGIQELDVMAAPAPQRKWAHLLESGTSADFLGCGALGFCGEGPQGQKLQEKAGHMRRLLPLMQST